MTVNQQLWEKRVEIAILN